MSDEKEETKKSNKAFRVVQSLKFQWKNSENLRNMVAFFIFGLANNFGYIVMLSAAFDLLSIFDDLTTKARIEEEKKLFKRDCNVLSTGAILLADIVPSFVIKMVAPFIPLWIHFRICCAVLTSALGLLLVAFATNKATILVGVGFVSFSSGLGESSLIAYMVFFKSKHVLATWASGTGAAGLVGSFAYSTLLQIGMSPDTAILIMLFMPVAMALFFWLVLKRPLQEHPIIQTQEQGSSTSKEQIVNNEPLTLKEKGKLVPHILLTYTSWFGLVYFFEYFINHGLYELAYIPGAFLSHKDQYRWYFSIYQLGVFVSRSTGTIVPIRRTWIQALVEGILLIVFFLEVIYGYMTYLAIPMILCFVEGLGGGSSYVNTYHRIAVEMPPNQRIFSLSLNSIGDSIMITLAGVASQPVHDTICKTPEPYK